MTGQPQASIDFPSLLYWEGNPIIISSKKSFDAFTGIILAGGKSSRMGQDKAFIPFKGVPLIEIILEVLTPLFPEIIIVAPQVETFKKYPVKTAEDVYLGRGSLGGLYTGLLEAKTPWIFATACDTPFLSGELIEALTRKARDCQVVIPYTSEGLQPLCALYHKDCLDPMKSLLDKSKLKIIEFFPQVKIQYFEEAELASIGLSPQVFFNINTPQDRQKAEALAQEGESKTSP